MSRKILIIDACVGTAASTNAKPVSKMCRDLLEEVIKSKHDVGFSLQLEDEWGRHPSKLSTLFLSSLKSRKRVVYLRDIEGLYDIRERVKLIPDKLRIDAITKDIHLVEAALSTDKIIISKDEKARNHFSNIMNIISEVQEIVWINPINDEEDSVNWIKSGANIEQERMLKSLVVN